MVPVNERMDEKNEIEQSAAAYFCVGVSLDPWKLSRRSDPVLSWEVGFVSVSMQVFVAFPRIFKFLPCCH